MMEFQVQGMSCGHCVGAVTKAVQALDAGANVKVDLAAKKVTVTSTAAAPAIIAAINDAGYPATPA